MFSWRERWSCKSDSKFFNGSCHAIFLPPERITRLEQAKYPAAEGRLICIDIVRELSAIPHVAGVHIMAPNNDAAVPDVIRAARESIKRPAVV